MDKAQEAIDLTDSTLMEWDKRKIEPAVAYAALGSAFLQLHMGLGKGKKEWLELVTEMAHYFPTVDQ